VLAAKEQRRRFIGIELGPRYYDVANERLKAQAAYDNQATGATLRASPLDPSALWTTSAHFSNFCGDVVESKARRNSTTLTLVRRWYESTTGIRTITWIRNNPPATSPHPIQQTRADKEMGPYAPEARNEARSSVLVELG
jgi:hypothetical protein